MSVSFRLGKAGWYCVTKGGIFLGAVLFFCASDISLSENLSLKGVFLQFYLGNLYSAACFEITHVLLKSKLRGICSQNP